MGMCYTWGRDVPPSAKIMTQKTDDQEFQELDEHWAANRDGCQRIGDRLGKRVKSIEGPLDKSLLPCRCLYDGPQTNFAEEADDNGQD